MAVDYSQLQQQQFQMPGCGAGTNPAAAMLFPQMTMMAVPPPVLSEPESELTCHLSGSRKRTREDDPLPLLPTASTSALFLYHQQQQQQQQQLLLQKHQLLLLNSQIQQRTKAMAQMPPADVAADSSRLIQSAMTSTSGRQIIQQQPSPAVSNIISSTTNPAGAPSPASPGLISMLHYQSLEVDALVRLHAEKLRAGLDDARKRHCRAVLVAVGQQAQRRVAEKQAELEAAAKRNAELEERLRHATAESQAWFNVARNSEALVASLRGSLEQALLQKLSDANEGMGNGNINEGICASASPGLEGYGDSEEEAVSRAAAASAEPSNPAEFAVAASKASPPSVAGTPRCRSCGSPDACVLVLPCRHLCICRSCDASVSDCPVCGSRKSGSLQINLC